MRFFFFFLFLLSTKIWAVVPNEEAYLPWGKEIAEIGQRTDGVFHLGPNSFFVKNNLIYILDSENKRIKIIKNHLVINKIDLPEIGFEDFVPLSGRDYLLMKNNILFEFRDSKLTKKFQPESRLSMISSISLVDNNSIVMNINDSFSILLKNKPNFPVEYKDSLEDGFGNSYFLQKKSWQTIEIVTKGIQKDPVPKMIIKGKSKNLALAKIIGSTVSGQLYVYLEKIIVHNPLRVEREVLVFDKFRRLLAKVVFPTHARTSIFKEFFVDEAGSLYQMISSEDGVHIIKWIISPNHYARDLKFPLKFSMFSHFNDNVQTVLDGPQISGISENINRDGSEFPVVKRSEALAIADQIIAHEWIAEKKNLTDGEEMDPDNNIVETPHWIKIGKNVGFPYCWGGFDDIAQFDSGLKVGKYAGDIETGDVSQYSAGVDCSGFVSRSWKLPSHYSTAMMDDWEKIGTYSRWEDLKAGDAIHKVGHVRLMVKQNRNGSLTVAEASAKDWKTSYRLYNYDQLSSYHPKYYLNMTD